MRRTPCCEKNGLKRGPWTPEEDQKLIDYIQKNGYRNWRTLPKNAGLLRCGKSCRLRWINYLRPDIKRGKFSLQEEETIIQLHRVLGNKWSAIAARLPGRTDNEIKNYWNTHIRKRLLLMGIDPVTHKPRLDLLHRSTLLLNPMSCLYNNPQSQMIDNFSRMLGLERSLINNQEMYSTSLLPASDHLQNPVHDFMVQNHLMINGPQQFQNQVEDTTILSTSSCVPLCKLDDQYAEVYEHFHGSLTMVDDTTTESFVYPETNYGCCGLNNNVSDDSINFQCNERNMNNFQDVSSNMSIPSMNLSPSPTTLCSSSTGKEERGSYCSTGRVLKFDVSDHMMDLYVNCLM